MPEYYKRINLKRKVFSRGGGGGKKFKPFKRTPKYIKDNIENQIAREKANDPYHFSDSDDAADDLGMGLEISDLPFLNEHETENAKELIAFTQDSVRPLFDDLDSCDDAKLDEALAELRYTSFRPNQKEAIKRILSGRSTLFISPTGSGKSLCYQLPALLYSRHKSYMTIVVSPLISLMEDQMNNFPKSLKAVSLHSGHNLAHRRRSIEMLMKGEAQVAFISPEAIVGGVLELEDLKNLPPVGFVCIDEAHCLSEWSHNFRPAYLQFLKILHDQMNIKTYLGLSATATRATALTIAKNLHINPDSDIVGSTTIPDNLLLSVSYENNKDLAIIKLIKSPTFVIMPSIIIYCNRREDTERVATRIRTSMQGYSSLIESPDKVKPSTNGDLTTNGENSSEKTQTRLTWNSEAYHAGLSMDTRKRIQRQFIKGEVRVVVATVAFGMGINKSNVRAIIHYDMPSSFESYVQEIGRAGRDGKPAQCHMFLKSDKTDIFYQQRNIYSSVADRKNIRKLVEYVFRPCKCSYWLERKPSELKHLQELNSQTEPHYLPYSQQVEDTKTTDINTSSEKENALIGGKPISKVKKHRACQGHEVAFPIEEATQQVNLKPEAIMTLICKLEQSYPQLKIKQFNPTKSTCTIFCYKGPEQMENLAKSSRVVQEVLKIENLEKLRTEGAKGPTPNKVTFDVVKIASILGKPSEDVIRMCKAGEWELVEKTGRFRRSQIRVSLEGNSFHLSTVGDLNDEEIEEINAFLLDYCNQYEKAERDKIAHVFHTLQAHCISVDQMNDKAVRLEMSSKLKTALNSYFDSSTATGLQTSNLESQKNLNINNQQINATLAREEAARKTVRAFLSAHGRNYSPRTIARIFQGISTPCYPAEHWGMNKKWWRTHLDLDFIRLTEIIREEQLK